MTYEEFCEYVQTRCIYDAIYEDSEGRYILVITMPRAFSMAQHVSRNKFYTAPPQREWQELTNEEIEWIKGSANRAIGYIRVTAAKLKEKNT